MDETWTIAALVEEAARRIAALPAPKNGQVRAVPDDRTVRYYGTIGLLDRPLAMRGRTALYGKKHVAQIVAIKRLQTMGRSLAEIQALWPTLDDRTLSRMSGVDLPATKIADAKVAAPAPRKDFWKREPQEAPSPSPAPSPAPAPAPSMPPITPDGAAIAADARAREADGEAEADRGAREAEVVATYTPMTGVELRIELAPDTQLSIAMSGDIAISPADVAAIRAAAAPLIAELARRRLGVHVERGDEV